MKKNKNKSSEKTGQDKRLDTLEVKTEKSKLEFLEQLKKTPIVQLACERTGIGRSTYYDWRSKDSEFAKVADKSIKLGELLINDIAESQLLRAIQNSNATAHMTALIFWLKNHHKSYNEKIYHEHEFIETEITPEERIKAVSALYNIGYYTRLGRNLTILQNGGELPYETEEDEKRHSEVMQNVENSIYEKLKNPEIPDPARMILKKKTGHNINLFPISIPESIPKPTPITVKNPAQKRKGVNLAEFFEKRKKIEKEKKRLEGK
jgi:hypothetical protein